KTRRTVHGIEIRSQLFCDEHLDLVPGRLVARGKLIRPLARWHYRDGITPFLCPRAWANKRHRGQCPRYSQSLFHSLLPSYPELCQLIALWIVLQDDWPGSLLNY